MARTRNLANLTDLLTAGSTYVTTATPPQFDNGTNIATTGFANGLGVQYKLGVAGLSFSINTTLTASQMGGWGIMNSASPLTVTLPLLSSVPLGAAFSIIGGQTGGFIAASGSDSVFNVSNASASQIAINAGETITVVADGPIGGWYSVNGGVGHTGFPSSLLSPGYQKFPSGLILQWGPTAGTSAGGSVTTTFPIAFPNACLRATGIYQSGTLTPNIVNLGAVTTTTATFWVCNTSGSAVTGANISYFALGN